jgi:hypothetical protein
MNHLKRGADHYITDEKAFKKGGSRGDYLNALLSFDVNEQLYDTD